MGKLRTKVNRKACADWGNEAVGAVWFIIYKMGPGVTALINGFINWATGVKSPLQVEL